MQSSARAVKEATLSWAGKLVGAILGYLLTRRPLGVLVGMLVGHFFDQRLERGRAGADGGAAEVRATFFRAAFGVMGHVAKADGRVSEQDIAAARRIFRQFNLGEADTRAAMEFFTRGKTPEFDLDATLAELAAACRHREELPGLFLQIQMRAALLGDGLQGRTRAVLMRVAQAIGISPLEFAHLETLLRLQGYGAGPAGAGGPARPQPDREALADAYEVLEVPPAASDAEVKRAYRRQMSRNHPDKLVARGLPEAMLEVAKQKTQAIQAAWERIRQARGLR